VKKKITILKNNFAKNTKPVDKKIESTCCIIGTGLIGGSLSYALQKNKLYNNIIGVEKNKAFAKKALDLGIVYEILPLPKAIEKSSLIILAIPVQEILRLLPKIMNQITTQTVMDVGSTKLDILETLKNHKNRNKFVATHPMWGTEHSGPSAAQKIAFKNNAVVLCNHEENEKTALQKVEKIYKKLGMQIIYMDAIQHDVHTAYISHISHITSFALANTVLQKEQDTATIFALASGGFASTVRLAKSNAAMWVPILQNKKNILDVLMELEVQIAEFKKHLIQKNEKGLTDLILNANKIKRILQ
jgi:prephenate dehydrogenase